MNVYFDNAATTKVRDEVIDNMSNVLVIEGEMAEIVIRFQLTEV